MIKTRIGSLAVLALCATLSACTYWSDDFDRLVDQTGRDFDRDPGRVYLRVDFDKIVESPHTYAFTDVQFIARLDRRSEKIFIPMYGSHFKSEDYAGVSLWSIDAQVWDPTVESKSVPTFFIKKNNPDRQRLVNMDRYNEVYIRGRVHNDFGNMPWVEIHYVDPVTTISTNRAKYQERVAEADRLVMEAAPVYQEVAAHADVLPDDSGQLADLHAKATMVRDNLSQARFRYEMSLYNAPDPIGTRDRIAQIRGLLETLAELIKAIEAKQAAAPAPAPAPSDQ